MTVPKPPNWPIPSRASITEARRLRAMAVDSAARVVAGTATYATDSTAEDILRIAKKLYQWIEDGASEHKQPGQERG